MPRLSTIASKSNKKTTATGPAAVDVLTPNIVRLKVIESEGGPAKEVTIDKNKRIKDNKLANELVERMLLVKALEGIKDHDSEAIKNICFAAGAKFVDAPNGIAQIVPGGEGGSINVAKFWRMCDVKKIPLAKRFEVMSVGKKAVTFLSADEVLKMLDFPAIPPQPRLTVQRRKEVAATTVKQALVALAKQAAAGKIENWEPKPKKAQAGATDDE